FAGRAAARSKEPLRARTVGQSFDGSETLVQGRRVLVTGGAGYIGSHTAKALARAGRHPVVFDDLSHGNVEAVRWGPLVVGGVRDPVALEACLREHRIDSVINFAGLIEVGRSAVEPDAFWDVNLGGVASVLKA